MTVSSSSTLFKAILSMDAYNRGYLPSIDLGLTTINSTKIGEATIIRQSDVDPGTPGVLAGFYAVAYSLSPTDTVISYRGTDELFGTDTTNGPVGGDLWNSYGIALGSIGSPQAAMSFSFYNSVAQQLAGSPTANPLTANISLTGHSSGGGLAGMVSDVYGKSSVIFDNMPFNSAASAIYGLVSSDPTSVVVSDVYSNVPGVKPSPSTSNISAYFLDGDFLETTRVGQTPTPVEISLGISSTDLATYGGTFAGHSSSSLVIMMFANVSLGARLQLQIGRPQQNIFGLYFITKISQRPWEVSDPMQSLGKMIPLPTAVMETMPQFYVRSLLILRSIMVQTMPPLDPLEIPQFVHFTKMRII